MEKLNQLKEICAGLPVEKALAEIVLLFPKTVKFSSSLGQEDQVLTDIIARNQIDVQFFTIDTGRLFNEVYELIDRTEARYRLRMEVYFPQSNAVQEMIQEKGINLFYESVPNRQQCCNIRKVEPLNRALENTRVWLTGLRAEQTGLRKNIPQVEWLEGQQLYKINPLLNWSYDEVMAYIQKYNVPYNPLHDKGFVSIGCAPCTRAIMAGEDIRAGRWWWENTQKECGLHLVK